MKEGMDCISKVVFLVINNMIQGLSITTTIMKEGMVGMEVSMGMTLKITTSLQLKLMEISHITSNL